MKPDRDWRVLLGAFIVPLALLLLGPALRQVVLAPLLSRSIDARNALVYYELFLIGPLFGLVAGLALRPSAIVAAGVGTTPGYALGFRYVPFSPQLLVGMTLVTLVGFALAAALAYGIRVGVGAVWRWAARGSTESA